MVLWGRETAVSLPHFSRQRNERGNGRVNSPPYIKTRPPKKDLTIHFIGIFQVDGDGLAMVRTQVARSKISHSGGQMSDAWLIPSTFCSIF
jgi:hypothetical protein